VIKTFEPNVDVNMLCDESSVRANEERAEGQLSASVVVLVYFGGSSTLLIMCPMSSRAAGGRDQLPLDARSSSR